MNERTLERIAAALEHLAGTSEALGFCDPPKPVWIFANRTKAGLWYTLDETGEPQECPKRALHGRIVALEYKAVQRRGEEKWKMQLHIQGDRLYIVEAGIDANFSRCVMATLAALDIEGRARLSRPVTLSVTPGEDSSILFADIYQDGHKLPGPYNSETNWRNAAQLAKGAVESDCP